MPSTGVGEDSSIPLEVASSSLLAPRGLLALQQTAGNAYVQRAIRNHLRPPRPSAPPAVSRDAAPAPPALDSRAWFDANREMVWRYLQYDTSRIALETGSSYAAWTSAASKDFVAEAFRVLASYNYDALALATDPSELDRAVRYGRDSAEAGAKPGEFHMESTWELSALLYPALQRGLRQVTPQYVTASYQASRERVPDTLSNSGIVPPQTAPDARLLTPSHPMEKVVIQALTAQITPLLLTVDYVRYSNDQRPPALDQSLKTLRPIEFTWRVDSLQGTWIRVERPADPTSEEVAQEMYGDSAMAPYLINAAPLFSLDPNHLAAPYKLDWIKNYFINGPIPTDLHLPIANLSDEAAINQGRTLPAQNSRREVIVQRMQASQLLLGQIHSLAAMLRIETEASDINFLQFQWRIERLSKPESEQEAKDWDAQSWEQFQVLQETASGLSTLVNTLSSMSKAAAPTPTPEPGAEANPGQLVVNFEPVGPSDVGEVQEPVLDAARLFLDVVPAYDLVVTARQRLEKAKARARTLPYDMLQSSLSQSRQVLANLGDLYPGRGNAFEVDHLKSFGQELREKLQDAKLKGQINPEDQEYFPALMESEVYGLYDAAILAHLMGETTKMINKLNELRSVIGIAGKNARYDAAAEKLKHDWWDRISYVYGEYLANFAFIAATARQDFFDLRGQLPELGAALQAVGEMIQKEEEREAWIKIGIEILASIAFAPIAAEIGAAVLAEFAEAGWTATRAGSIAARVVSVGAEQFSNNVFNNLVSGQPMDGAALQSFLIDWGFGMAGHWIDEATNLAKLTNATREFGSFKRVAGEALVAAHPFVHPLLGVTNALVQYGLADEPSPEGELNFLEVEGIEITPDEPTEEKAESRTPVQRAGGPPPPSTLPYGREFEDQIEGMLRRGSIAQLNGPMDAVIRGQYNRSGHGIDFIGVRFNKSGSISLFRVEVKGSLDPALGLTLSGTQTGRGWTANAIDRMIENERLANLLKDRLGIKNINEIAGRLKRARNVVIVHETAILGRIGRQIGGLARHSYEAELIRVRKMR